MNRKAVMQEINFKIIFSTGNALLFSGLIRYGIALNQPLINFKRARVAL